MKKVFTLLFATALAIPALAQSDVASNNIDWSGSDDVAFLGVYYWKITPIRADYLNLEEPYGNRVVKIANCTAAERNYFQPLDYIVGIDDIEFDENMDLRTALETQYKPGDKAKVHFIRNGKRMTEKVKLGKRSDVCTDEHEDVCLGVSFNPVTSGLRVNTLVQHSPADAMGIEPNDEIVAVNGINLPNGMKDLRLVLRNLIPGEEVTVEVIRDEESVILEGPVTQCGVAVTEENEIVEGIQGNMTYKDMPIGLEITELTLYPNPSDGLFRVDFNTELEGPFQLSVLDNTGKQVLTQQLNSETGLFNTLVDMDNPAKGLYFLVISNGEKLMTKKIAIQ